MFVFSWLERLAAGIFVMAFLIVGGWVLQAFNVPPEAAANFFASKVLYDVAVLGSLLPYLAALVGMAGVIFMLAHHREYAVLSWAFSGLFIVAAFAWNLGLNSWVAAHLARLA